MMSSCAPSTAKLPVPNLFFCLPLTMQSAEPLHLSEVAVPEHLETTVAMNLLKTAIAAMLIYACQLLNATGGLATQVLGKTAGRQWPERH